VAKSRPEAEIMEATQRSNVGLVQVPTDDHLL